VRAIVINDPIEHALPQTSSLQTVSVSDGRNQQRWVLGDNTAAALSKMAQRTQ